MPKITEEEQQFGHCTACFEITSVNEPCCPMAGVLINGEVVRPLSGFGDGEE